VPVGVAFSVVLGACGADPGATVSTLRPLSSTNYATTPPSSLAPLDPANTAPPPIGYTIKAGDSVYGIASQFGVRPDELASYNNWAEGVNRQLLVGETILVPPSPSQTTTLPGLPLPTETTVAPPEPPRGTYEVKLGDSITIIADKCGIEVSSLLRINGWPDMNVRIFPGDDIKIPAATKSYEKSECDGV
jgi:LysM repeat protein